LFLKAKLEEIGFKQKLSNDMQRIFERLGLELKRLNSKTKKEVGFEYSKNGLTVHVWTTWVAEDNAMNEQDSGWVLITEGDTAQYFAKPYKRCAGFIQRILSYAWIAMFKVENRPLCPTCGKFMNITQG